MVLDHLLAEHTAFFDPSAAAARALLKANGMEHLLGGQHEAENMHELSWNVNATGLARVPPMYDCPGQYALNALADQASGALQSCMRIAFDQLPVALWKKLDDMWRDDLPEIRGHAADAVQMSASPPITQVRQLELLSYKFRFLYSQVRHQVNMDIKYGGLDQEHAQPILDAFRYAHEQLSGWLASMKACTARDPYIDRVMARHSGGKLGSIGAAAAWLEGLPAHMGKTFDNVKALPNNPTLQGIGDQVNGIANSDSFGSALGAFTGGRHGSFLEVGTHPALDHEKYQKAMDHENATAHAAGPVPISNPLHAGRTPPATSFAAWKGDFADSSADADFYQRGSVSRNMPPPRPEVGGPRDEFFSQCMPSKQAIQECGFHSPPG